ncbi:MAG: mannonate dehydratase [Acetobacteraceae bacterium]|nr:mannonate dehydratase [Acetobacteraceae bacterium]
MHIGEQLINPTEARLHLSAQLGAQGIVIDTRPNNAVMNDDGLWDSGKIAEQRRWIEGFGMKLEVMAIDVGSILLDSLRAPELAAARAEELRHNIQAAALGGIDTVKFNLQMVGITRTAMVEGRGGVKCSAFKAADYRPEADKEFSYWGVGHIGGGKEGSDAPAIDLEKPEACGQVLASEAGGISREQGWSAIQYLIEQILPTAERAGVRLAIHPQDPAYPPEGLNGVHHVVGSLDGMHRLLDLAPESPSLGLNFCQGTIGEMSPDPNATVLQAIREFGARKRIFMVHFRNIKGGYLDFREAFPDEGVLDMAACLRAYRDVGYNGILCPDHVPLSDYDVGRERFFAFALGYTRGLMQAI